MANTIDSDLNLTTIAQSALNAFVSRLTPLRAFSTNFSSEFIEKKEKVEVPYYPLAAEAKDFTHATGYEDENSEVDAKELAINKHKYVIWNLTDTEMANSPVIELERFGMQKGFSLAKKVLQDVFSIVLAANFGAPAFTGSASGFDSDDVIDIEGACNTADMPEEMRSLIVSNAYNTALLKDGSIKNALNFGNNQAITTGKVPNILGFDYYRSNLIPGNGENLVGMAVYPSAILIAMRVLAPHKSNKYSIVDVVTDPETGITIQILEWYDETHRVVKRVMECNYGYAVGESAALKRLVSA